MKVTIKNSDPQLSEEDITAMESRIGRSIPKPYRDFLLQHNGGCPTPSAFYMYDLDTSEKQEAGIHYFIEISFDANATSGLEWKLKTFEDRIPKHFFPFADDPGGNLLCISTAGEDEGSVYFWDHEREVYEDEEPGYDNLYFVAKSFDDLLDSLFEPT